MRRMSASVSTKILISIWSRSPASVNTRIPSTMMTALGSTRRVPRRARVLREVVDRHVDRLALAERAQVRDQELALE